MIRFILWYWVKGTFLENLSENHHYFIITTLSLNMLILFYFLFQWRFILFYWLAIIRKTKPHGTEIRFIFLKSMRSDVKDLKHSMCGRGMWKKNVVILHFLKFLSITIIDKIYIQKFCLVYSSICFNTSKNVYNHHYKQDTK